MKTEFAEDAACDPAAFESAAVFACFSELSDPRQHGKVVYPLVEVLILVLLAVMAGAEAFTEIERFGKVKLPLLRRFAPFKNGTPPHDTLGDIFAALDFEAFQKGFAAWAARFVGVPGEVVAIDGKTARRTFKKAKGEAAIHVSPPPRSNAVWFSGRSRPRRSRTRSPPFPGFWTRSASSGRP